MRMAVFNALRAGFEGDANHHDSLCIAEHLSPNAWTSFLQTGGPSPWRTAGVRRSCRLFEPGERQKIWKGAFPVCIYYKPLKSHKTAKEFFGNPWRKQADIWKCFGKKLGGFQAAARRCAVVRDARGATRIARHSLASREFLSLLAFRRVRPRRHRL
jgi:hypothetical protein